MGVQPLTPFHSRGGRSFGGSVDGALDCVGFVDVVGDKVDGVWVGLDDAVGAAVGIVGNELGGFVVFDKTVGAAVGAAVGEAVGTAVGRVDMVGASVRVVGAIVTVGAVVTVGVLGAAVGPDVGATLPPPLTGDKVGTPLPPLES